MKQAIEFSADEWLTFITQCADEADQIAKHYFNSVTLKVDRKKDLTPVSEGDVAIEKAIRKHVEQHCPDLAILGEEFGEPKEDAPVKLIIDPIDGTQNFIRGIPIYAALLAIEKDNQIIAGMVSAGTGDRWWAGKNSGAYHNGQPIHVSKVDKIEESMALHGSLFGGEARGNHDQLMQLLSKTYRQRGFGDYLMHTMVASGQAEFAVDFGLAPWDLAPLGIIVEEAGGTITNQYGAPFTPYGKSIFTSNGQFHDQILFSKYDHPENHLSQ